MAYSLGLPSNARYDGGTSLAGVTSGIGVKGSWSSASPASTFTWDGFWLYLGFTSGTNAGYNIDVAINNGGTRTIIVADYWIQLQAVVLSCPVFFPITVPSGYSVDVRAQGASAANVSILAFGVAGDSRFTHGFTRAANFGTTNFSMTGTTFTAWNQVTASTPNRSAGLYIQIYRNTQGQSAVQKLVQVGVGSAGNEKLVCEVVGCQFGVDQAGSSAPFWCDIPAGARLAVRGQSDSGDSNIIFVALMGLAA